MTTKTSNKTLVLALLVAAQFMVILDASIVNVALPSLGDDLNFSQQNLAWVVNAYVLAFGGFLLLGGRIADIAGRRATFVREEESGLASGLVNTGQQIGGALGLGIMATIATTRTEDLLGAGAQVPAVLTEGFQDAFLVGAGFALTGVVLALVLLRHRELREAQRELATREQAVPAQA